MQDGDGFYYIYEKKMAERTVSEINTNYFFLCGGQVDAKYSPYKLKGESCQSSFSPFMSTPLATLTSGTATHNGKGSQGNQRCPG